MHVLKIHTKTYFKHYLISGLILGTLLLSFLNYKVPFVYDDINQIVENTYYAKTRTLESIVKDPVRPQRFIQNLTFAFNWEISGHETWSYHLFNNILHLANSLLLLFFLFRVNISNPFIIFGTTLFFFIHPLQVESVTYVMGRSELLKTFFTFTVLNFYLCEKRSKTLIYIFLVIGLLAKETCVLTPILLLSLDFTVIEKSKNRSSFKEHLLYFSHAIWLYPISKVFPPVAYQGTVGFDLFPFWDYIHTNFYYLIFYINLFLNPSEQSIYHEWVDNPALGIIILGLLTYFVMLIFIIKYRKTRSTESFFIILFLVSFLPHNSIFQYINPFTEYRLYQPNISFSFFILLILAKLPTRDLGKYVITFAVIIYFLFFHFTYVKTWHNPIELWGRAYALYPKSFMTNLGLYNVYTRMRWCRNAEKHLESMCTNADKYSEDAKCFFGRLYLGLLKGDIAFAVEDYERLYKKLGQLNSPKNYDVLLKLLEDSRRKDDFNQVLHDAQIAFPEKFNNRTYNNNHKPTEIKSICMPEEKEIEIDEMVRKMDRI